MNKFIKGLANYRCLGVGVFSLALVVAFSSAAFAETQESVKSQVMGFAKKKATAEIVESAPVAPVESVAVSTPVFMPPASIKPSIATTAVTKPTPVVAAAPIVAPVAAPAVSGSEAQTKLQAIKTQEQWIAKLTKQLEGEKNQLIEMRTGLSQAFSLDPKKLEAGKYAYDTKAGKIVEGK